MHQTSTADSQHPASTELDRLRAGLLDREPALRARLLDHIGQCPHCQVRLDVWQTLARGLDSGLDRQPGLTGALRARRRAALAGEGARRPRYSAWLTRGLPLAAALSVMAAVGLTVMVNTAPTPAPAVAQAENAPDLYVDLDFYLWLSEQEANRNAPDNRS